MYVIEYGRIRGIRRGTKMKEGVLAVGVWDDNWHNRTKQEAG